MKLTYEFPIQLEDRETEQGERLIEVSLKDKETQEIIGTKLIKRALLAKYMQPLTEHNVSANNGKFIIEI